MDKITFTTEDCIKVRAAVVRFLNGMKAGKTVTNAVNEKEPEINVAFDFVALLFINMLYYSNEQVEEAAKSVVNGKPIFQQQAKQALGYYRRSWNQIRLQIPMHDNHFVAAYSDLDDQLCSVMENLVQQTYYPILNELLKSNKDIDSSIMQCLAHLLTADLFAGMSILHGFKSCLHYKSAILSDIITKIERLACNLPQVYGYTDISEDSLHEKVVAAEHIISNTIQPILKDILDQAKTLDLKAYIDSVDITWGEIQRMNMGKVKIKSN